MRETKPAKTHVIILRGQWTEESAYKAVCSWLLLSTSQKLPIDMVVSQNDDMAVGARRAFQEWAGKTVKEKWLNLPFTGVDGLPRTGQEYVRRGTLAATVVVPPLTIPALETLARAFQTGSQPPEIVLAAPTCFPPLEELARKRLSKAPTITS
jgi:ABC-type sugar transport system substrate-binding protein